MSEPNTAPSEQRVQQLIDALLSVKELKNLVGFYFNGLPKTDFAGHLFDSLSDNPPERVVASDLVAVTLLDVNFGPRATDQLLNRGCLNPYLASRKLPTNVDLWSAIDHTDDLHSARNALKELEGVGPVKASKLLARKRPRLAPITDRHVESFFGCHGWEFLEPLAKCLANSERLVRAINDLCPANTSPNEAPTTLRLLDVAIWMTRSRSTGAAEAREAALGSRDPLA
jgi:hypothetical protein